MITIIPKWMRSVAGAPWEVARREIEEHSVSLDADLRGSTLAGRTQAEIDQMAENIWKRDRVNKDYWKNDKAKYMAWCVSYLSLGR